MPTCAEPRCPVLVASGRCPAHQPVRSALKQRDRQRRRAGQPGRRWYYSAPWQRLRDHVLRSAAWTCAGCGHVVLELDVDHITPHRGNPQVFWNRANLQALCKTCHARKTHGGE